MLIERKNVAQRMRNYRRDRGINQFEFSQECGISEDTVGLMERKRANATLDTLELVAMRMGITVAELLQSGTTYIIVHLSVEIEEKNYHTYGIGVLRDFELVACVNDVSTDYDLIKETVHLCNEHGLALNHLNDIVEDMLV